VIWILGVTGILLTLLGMWGGPARARKRREMEALAARKQPTADEAWDTLARPLENEAIKLPEHKPWNFLGGDRRFMRGLFVGLGSGLMMAAVAVSLVPREAASPSATVAEKPKATETAKSNAPAPAPAAQQQPAAQPAAQAPKPANVTFVVEPGDLATTIAANLKAQGLIADEDAFLSRVSETGADTALKAGTFVVPTGANLDQVIEALTM
jgi:hypothetical protein